MAMTDQQVQDAINTAYAQFGGAGFEAHRAIARFMEQNSVPVGQVARLTGYSPQEVQAEFAAQTSPQAKQQQVQEFFQGNPTATDQQIFQYMRQNNLSPDLVIQTMGLDSDDSMRRYRDQVVNTAQRGQVTQEQLQAYFQNNPNATDAEVYANMQAYGVTPQQVGQALGLPLSEVTRRFREQQAEQTPTGLVGFEEAAGQGLRDATATLQGAETTSRGDINAAMQNINQMLGQNIEGFQQAGTTASNQINTGFDAALGSINQLYGQNIGDLRAAEATANQQVGAGYDQGIETLNRLYGINIDDLRAAADQASQQVNTGFDEARGYFQPFQQGGAQAFQQQLALSGALGQDAFNAARQQSPYEQFLFEQGMRGNLAGAAATGGLGGGNVQRELQRFGQGLASQGLQQQISNLSGLSGMGMQGSQALSGLATGRAGALGDIGINTAQNIAAQRGTQAQGVSGLQTQRGSALGDIAINTAQNVAGQRGTQAQSVSGLQTGRAGALGDITLNTMSNIAGQRGNMANFAGQAGINLANLSQRAGEGIADLQYGTGRDIATQRGRAGELIANQIQDVYGNQANLLQNLGTNQSNMIGGQASDLINLQNAAALRAQQNAINLGGSMSNLQTGLATSTANQISGQPLYNQQPFDYQGMYTDAFNQASGGADLMDQALNQRQKAAPATTSVPSFVRQPSNLPAFLQYPGVPRQMSQPNMLGGSTVPNFMNLTPNFRNLT
jgi:hypothetical protein